MRIAPDGRNERRSSPREFLRQTAPALVCDSAGGGDET
jgi:hypothetical protein